MSQLLNSDIGGESNSQTIQMNLAVFQYIIYKTKQWLWPDFELVTSHILSTPGIDFNSRNMLFFFKAVQGDLFDEMLLKT